MSDHVETLNLLSMLKNENRSCIVSGKVLACLNPARCGAFSASTVTALILLRSGIAWIYCQESVCSKLCEVLFDLVQFLPWIRVWVQ